MKESFAEKIYTKKGRVFDALAGLTVYNLGCGEQSFPNTIGIDRRENEGAKIVADLDTFPWPIRDSTADLAIMFHTLEHLDDLNKVMEEMWRILKPEGRVIVEVPYFRHPGAFQDPTHKHFFTTDTMKYFCVNEKRKTGRYTTAKFKEIGIWVGWPASPKNIISRIFKSFINNHKKFYDTYLSVFFPAKILVIELEAIK